MPQRIATYTQLFHGLTKVISNKVSIWQARGPIDLKKPPDLKSAREFWAVWDTGATSSGITGKVVKECGLEPIDIDTIQTPAGSKRTHFYLVNIALPNKLAIPSVRVAEIELLDPVDALIGMDIINKGDFAITNKDKKTMFSFRLPSITHVDWAKQPPNTNDIVESKPLPSVGRNDPCPCGSGKKYKKCCGKN